MFECLWLYINILNYLRLEYTYLLWKKSHGYCMGKECIWMCSFTLRIKMAVSNVCPALGCKNKDVNLVLHTICNDDFIFWGWCSQTPHTEIWSLKSTRCSTATTFQRAEEHFSLHLVLPVVWGYLKECFSKVILQSVAYTTLSNLPPLSRATFNDRVSGQQLTVAASHKMCPLGWESVVHLSFKSFKFWRRIPVEIN